MLVEGALFVWVNGLAVLLSARLVRRLVPEADAATRVLAGLILFVAVGLLCLLGLGAVGWIAPFPLAGLLLVLVVLERLLPQPAALEIESLSRPSAWGWIGIAAVGLLCGRWVWTIVGSGVGFEWDDLAYHAVAPAWWLQNGTLSLPPFNYQSYYPMNAELHGLWFLLPFGFDAHANLATLTWLAVVVAASAVLARTLRHPTLLAAAALCAFLLAPDIDRYRIYFTPTDLAVAGFALATLALAWIPREASKVTGRALLCGIAAGLALGTKATAAPLPVLVGLWWIWPGRRLEGALVRVSAYSAGVALLGSFWYVRNLLVAGNPVFPAELGPFAGPLTAGVQSSTTLSAVLLEQSSGPAAWKLGLSKALDWPLPLGLAALFGYAACAWTALREPRTQRRGYRVLLLLVAGAFVALFPFQPFSGMANRPETLSLPGFIVRYLTFPFLLGLALIPSLFHRAEDVTSAPCKPRVPPWAWSVGLLVALAGLAISTPAKEAATSKRLGSHYGAPPISRAWSALETLPDGSRVAMISNDPSSHSLIYPLFGRRLQHRPVSIYWNGARRDALHRTWRQEPASWWWEFDKTSSGADRAELTENLRASGVEFLVVSKWPMRGGESAPWPKMRQGLVGLDPNRRVRRGSYGEIWDLRDAPEWRDRLPR